jgi:transcriptional regulator with XRE-family HTH domain
MTEMSCELVEFVVGRLEKLASARGISQRELAEQSGVTQPAISKIFTRSQKPSPEVLTKLCAAFGLTLAGVLEEIDTECQRITGYLATPLTAVVQSPKAEAELKRVIGEIRHIASDREFSDLEFEIYWPGDHTHPTRNPDFKANLVYLKDRSTASTYNFLVIFCADPSYGVGQENEIATQAGIPAIRLVPARLSRMMAGSFILSHDVKFEGSLSSKITFDEDAFKEALRWARKICIKHQALHAYANGKGFGHRLRQLISERYGDYQKFADEIGVAPHYVNALMDEPIAVSNPSIRLLQRMGSILRVSVGHLIAEGEEDDPVWLESNASWNSWMRDGAPKDGGIAIAMRDKWRADYKAQRLEVSIASSRRTIKAMRTRDWAALYEQRSQKGKSSKNGSLF